MGQGVSSFNEERNLGKSIWALIQKIDVLVRFVDRLSNLHPYVNATWQLVSALHKAISHQIETDRKLVDLVHAMEGAYTFVTNADSLPDKTKRLQQTLAKLLQQTIECCRFVLHYADRNFPGILLSFS
ncbi:uncharacterized protein FOMMEDRAFT_160144 [Fomitiporia mediterranea MF3/22]|uniref:uncharacterized protein n=1 Tax=Fomitiporia mediterranea (strain MF3/22) TaxID=694068 RepID=UPI0004407E75|nr:uncharacterized protein FOMMEDRAFT_160144 [Fomitiporia mediterranea MF3/22]EJC99712.1 hypothetical protein FOMMEDRAFT_160144 [Fomitiporia mediterranea MF3/22]